MTPTITHTLIALCCLGTLPAASHLSPPKKPLSPALATAASLAAQIAQVNASMTSIEQRNALIRQRIRHMETLLLKGERLAGTASNKPLQLSQPHLIAAATPSVSMSAALTLQIDVPVADDAFETALNDHIAQSDSTSQNDSIATSPIRASVSASRDTGSDAAPPAHPTEAATLAEPVYKEPRLDGMLAVNDNALGEMRGGFTTTSGLQISFGIERAVYLNGNLMTLTSLNVADLTKLATVLIQPSKLNGTASTADTAAALASVQTLPSTQLPTAASSALNNLAEPATITEPAGVAPNPTTTSLPASVAGPTTMAEPAGVAPNPTTTSLPASVAGPTTIAEPASVASNPTTTSLPATSTATSSTTSSNSATATIVQPNESSGGSLALIQSGSGNVLPSNMVLPSAIGTIIQNSLDNQKIQNVTVVNATVNSLDILKEMNLQSTISNAVANSLKR